MKQMAILKLFSLKSTNLFTLKLQQCFNIITLEKAARTKHKIPPQDVAQCLGDSMYQHLKPITWRNAFPGNRQLPS